MTVSQEGQATRDRLRQLAGIREDYEALRARLGTLAAETRHDVMVPFTRVAYLPGTLRHTNEITCLLGDNWFVERSAAQAAEMVDRRLKSTCVTIQLPSRDNAALSQCATSPSPRSWTA